MRNYCLDRCVKKRRRGRCAQRVCRQQSVLHNTNRNALCHDSTHNNPSASAASFRGAREAEALSEELSLDSPCPEAVSEDRCGRGCCAWQRKKCTRSIAQQDGFAESIRITTICTTSPKSKSSSIHMYCELENDILSVCARETDGYIWMGKKGTVYPCLRRERPIGANRKHHPPEAVRPLLFKRMASGREAKQQQTTRVKHKTICQLQLLTGDPPCK